MTVQNNKKTLAIIDDDRNFCDYNSGYFANSMTEILTAHTGAEGLGICSSRKVDVVLLDQKLPDAEGVDLCAPILNTLLFIWLSLDALGPGTLIETRQHKIPIRYIFGIVKFPALPNLSNWIIIVDRRG